MKALVKLSRSTLVLLAVAQEGPEVGRPAGVGQCYHLFLNNPTSLCFIRTCILSAELEDRLEEGSCTALIVKGLSRNVNLLSILDKVKYWAPGQRGTSTICLLYH